MVGSWAGTLSWWQRWGDPGRDPKWVMEIGTPTEGPPSGWQDPSRDPKWVLGLGQDWSWGEPGLCLAEWQA